MIVNQWPTVIHTAAGIVYNPTPEQCQAAGYELAIPPTVEEMAEAARIAQEQAQERTEEIEGMRTAYRMAARTFCQLAGLPAVDKFEDSAIIQTAITAANETKDFERILGLTQTALSLQHIITELRRKDGDDAWQRI